MPLITSGAKIKTEKSETRFSDREKIPIKKLP